MEKTFDAGKAEPRLYAKWEEGGAFRAGANASRKETFCIMMPPPNVTGSLHMGHAFNNTLQDILIRWKRMRGFDTLWQPGQDHAGIATQMVVERELAGEGKSRRDFSREEFIERVWEQKRKSGGTIVDQLKRLGASCDWSRAAFTMSGAPGAPEGEEGNFHGAVIKVFVEMYEKGLIYRDKRLVNWDPHFETAISDLEVENIEVAGHMWHFKYPLAEGETYTYVRKDADGNVVLEEERDYISIATTRPETMLGDGAVAVHPSDGRYAPIVGKLCEIPVGPKEHRRSIPIITDDYPDPDFGSGAVKITGAHDFNDYKVAKRNGIPMYRLMDDKGRMRETDEQDGRDYAECAARARAIAEGAEYTGDEIEALNLVPDDLRGLDRFEARKRVVEQITREGLAVTVQDDQGETVPLVDSKPIVQPFGDRSKVVIEPMLKDQWFVDTAKIVRPAIDAVKNGETRIVPEQDRKVYFNWLENIEPWCISRQLWWGHRIPVWHDGEGNRFCAPNVDEAFEKYIRSSGHDWMAHKHKGTKPEEVLTQDEDVLDTWFSSGLWPMGTLGWPDEKAEAYRKYFPTDVLITGFDILFFWVARMMMMQYAVAGRKPFSTVYVHALVRDEKGKKMSKSLGNVLDPLELIDEYGADAVRFTLTAMAAMGRDLKLSASRVAGYRNFGTKLWNAARFARMNGAAGGDEGFPRPEATVNRWIVGETVKVLEEVNAALEAFRFNDAANALYAFVWGKVCDWYVEFSKPLLNSGDDAIVAETRRTMGWTIDQCLILLHPIMPFVTEELWGEREKMLIHADWPTYGGEPVDVAASREMNWVIGLIEGIRSARAQVHVPAGLKIPMICQSLDSAGREALERNRAPIFRLARIGSLTDSAELPEGSITIAVEGGVFALPLADVIDIGEERARLEKSLLKIGKELGGLRGRLSNPKFVESAPGEVVEETRAHLAAREEEETKLKAALERLARIA